MTATAMTLVFFGDFYRAEVMMEGLFNLAIIHVQPLPNPDLNKRRAKEYFHSGFTKSCRLNLMVTFIFHYSEHTLPLLFYITPGRIVMQ